MQLVVSVERVAHTLLGPSHSHVPLARRVSLSEFSPRIEETLVLVVKLHGRQLEDPI